MFCSVRKQDLDRRPTLFCSVDDYNIICWCGGGKGATWDNMVVQALFIVGEKLVNNGLLLKF